MIDRPILFRGQMVRAILAGAKTQTRRLYKPRAPEPYEVMSETPEGKPWPYCEFPDTMNGYEPRPSPYGEPVDRLWVRETWRYAGFTEDGYPFIRCRADDATSIRERVDPAWSDRLTDIWAKLSEPSNYDIDGKAADRVWRPAIFMPRWASRITLEVRGVRVERLQDISEEDARAEGVEGLVIDGAKVGADVGCQHGPRTCHRCVFSLLWDSSSGIRGPWDANPWVWVVSFDRSLAPVDTAR